MLCALEITYVHFVSNVFVKELVGHPWETKRFTLIKMNNLNKNVCAASI